MLEPLLNSMSLRKVSVSKNWFVVILINSMFSRCSLPSMTKAEVRVRPWVVSAIRTVTLNSSSVRIARSKVNRVSVAS